MGLFWKSNCLAKRGAKIIHLRGRQTNIGHTCNSGDHTGEHMKRSPETIIKLKKEHVFGNL